MKVYKYRLMWVYGLNWSFLHVLVKVRNKQSFRALALTLLGHLVEANARLL